MLLQLLKSQTHYPLISLILYLPLSHTKPYKGFVWDNGKVLTVHKFSGLSREMLHPSVTQAAEILCPHTNKAVEILHPLLIQAAEILHPSKTQAAGYDFQGGYMSIK